MVGSDYEKVVQEINTDTETCIQDIQTMADAMQQKTTEAEEAVEISHTAVQVLKESNKKMNELKDAIGEISECSEQQTAQVQVMVNMMEQFEI